MLAPGATDVLAAVEYAHPRATISFDPNCRPSIITDVDYARRQAEKFVTLADVVRAKQMFDKVHIPVLGITRQYRVVEYRGIEPQEYDPLRIVFRLDAAGNIQAVDCG